ncbi:MAG: DNA repair exonuclease [Candidatus Diapherotrites archaeon]
MRLAIVSDTHLGFARGTPREEDAFFNLKQALVGIVSQSPDVIIFPGDLFDHKIPSQEVWHECFELFGLIQNGKNSSVKITHFSRDGKTIPFHYHGIPVIAIAGTHEYRSKDLKNALQVLETGNFLACLHASHVLIEKDGEKVAIHGMSGIPEKRALDALKLYNPIPIPGVHNLLVLHQSIKEFLPSKDDMAATIGLSDLPAGFDLLVNGHLHWSSITEWEDKKLLIPGSTVFTQMKRLEGEKKKGWYVYDTQTKELVIHIIPKQRKLFYHCMKFKHATPKQVMKSARALVEKDLRHSENELLPLYRLKLKGTLEKGYTQADVDFARILDGFSHQALFSTAKSFDSGEFSVRLDELRSLHRSNVSMAQMGISLLEKNLSQTSFSERLDAKRLFALLEDKENMEKAIQLLEKGELIFSSPEESSASKKV